MVVGKCPNCGTNIYTLFTYLKADLFTFSQQTAPTHLCLYAVNLRATPKNIYNMPTQKYNPSYTNCCGFSSNFHTNSLVKTANFAWVGHNIIEPIHSPDLASHFQQMLYQNMECNESSHTTEGDNCDCNAISSQHIQSYSTS